MAYQLTQPNNVVLRTLNGFAAAFGGFFTSMTFALMATSAQTKRVQDFKALHDKSDAELTALGIKRDDIVHHVFQDLYYS